MATIDDIAREAGVSRATAYNILNQKYKATWPSAAKRAALVRQIAAELDYRPNAAAKAVVTGRFGSIGLLFARVSSEAAIFEAAFRAIRSRLSDLDLHLTTGDVPDDKLTSDKTVPKLLREWLVDGLIISYTSSIPDRMLEIIHKNHIPSIWLNTKLKADCVYPDDVQGARMATEYLLNMRHRRIALFLPAHSNHYSVEDRQKGYTAAMRKAGLQPQVHKFRESFPPEGYDDYKRILAEPDRPTAVLAYHPDFAFPTYCAALELDLTVPRDLSIVVINDGITHSLGFVMTTLLIPAGRMGGHAVDMVLKKIAEPQIILSPQVLPFEIFEGVTCAPPPSAGRKGQ